MHLEKKSPCKVNLLLNILGKRADGFHELETVMQPVNLFDELIFEHGGKGIQLSCNDVRLPTDSSNLVHRAAIAFQNAAKIHDKKHAVHIHIEKHQPLAGGPLKADVAFHIGNIHLEKKLPLAAGLGGGSGNAATTLLGLNELFGNLLSAEQLYDIAAKLGSDIPFFLQNKPALATGRGEKIQPLEDFPALRGKAFLLIHPGFGIATAWAYENLARFPVALGGKKGRAEKLISLLQTSDLRAASAEFYNSLEAPALEKYPVLALYQEFLRANGALAALMSGSGSTTFAIAETKATAESLVEKFKSKFGANCWMAVIAI